MEASPRHRVSYCCRLRTRTELAARARAFSIHSLVFLLFQGSSRLVSASIHLPRRSLLISPPSIHSVHASSTHKHVHSVCRPTLILTRSRRSLLRRYRTNRDVDIVISPGKLPIVRRTLDSSLVGVSARFLTIFSSFCLVRERGFQVDR